MAFDGASWLESTQLTKNPMAYLPKALLTEKNYKGIVHVRRNHSLLAFDPQCWLFGYEAGGKVWFVQGDSPQLPAGTPLTPCPTTPPHRIPTHPDCAAGGGYTWPSVSAHMRTTERAVVVFEVPRPFLPPPCRPACSSSAALQRGLVS